MMKEILRIINDTGVVNESELADATKTSPAMVQQAINMLQSKGYLNLISLTQTCEASHCASCGHCNSTAQTSKYAYTITEKGKQYLQTP